jgi:integrase
VLTSTDNFWVGIEPNVRGSLPIKKRIPGCLPIRRLSGTRDPKMVAKLVRMLDALHEQGRDDLVNAVARGTIKPLQLYNTWKFNRLEDLPHADELPLFRDAWPRWLDGPQMADRSEEHRENIRKYFVRLERDMPADATLAGVVPALHDWISRFRTRPRTLSLVRSHVQAFLRDTVGRRHRLWLEVAELALPRVRPVRTKHPLTADKLRALAENLGSPCGMMAWTMATTGMGWREYVGPWEREGEGLRIHGTKTHGRDRLVPLVVPPHRPSCGLVAFRKKLKAQGITVYDLRRTYANLMVEAGVPKPRRSLYMGHTARDMTELYEWSEVREYLAKDADRMRAILGTEREPELKVVRA